jgi:arylsulfatase A-like enzyme
MTEAERQSSLTRREFVRAAGAAGIGVLAAAGRGDAALPGAARPNIVYVFADQHRNCSWSGGGDPQVKTPNLESLARKGVVFNHCISNDPLCSPHRASLLTGRYPQANKVTKNVSSTEDKGLPATEVTIGEVLKNAGYATGYVGKWHLYPGAPGGSMVDVVPPGPHRHGFDYWRACHNYRKRYDTRYYNDDGKEIVIPGYAPTGQMDLTLEFIEKNAARPFCVFLSWHPPHGPYTEAPKRFVDMYSPDKIKLRLNVPKEADTRKWREHHAGYFAHVSALDEEMGRLIEKLAQLEIAGNTILCYSSDHGDMLASLGMTTKNKPWEESINVPFVIRWPRGIPAGRRLDTLFSTVDVTPTLLGLAGVPVLPRMQGLDLSAVVQGKSVRGPESVFIMAAGGASDDDDEGKSKSRKGSAVTKKRIKGWRGIRTARHTYVKRGAKDGFDPWLLYDNEKDPFQMRDVIDDPAQQQTRKELDAKLGQWRRRVGEA